jgi:hypothetical protein
MIENAFINARGLKEAYGRQSVLDKLDLPYNAGRPSGCSVRAVPARRRC